MGDAGACRIQTVAGSNLSCRFYREHVREPSEDVPLALFWDFEWTVGSPGRAHLSALTMLADDAPVEFVVEVCQGAEIVEDSDSGSAPPFRGPVLERVEGTVRRGVAYAQWAHGDYDPFDARFWFQHPIEESAPRSVLPEYQPPVFTILGDTGWGQAGPPGQRLRSLRTTEPISGAAVALRSDGKLLWVPSFEARKDLATEHRVVGVFQAGRVTRGTADEKGDA